jgi:endonuclease YncB( thermonuclease family)
MAAKLMAGKSQGHLVHCSFPTLAKSSNGRHDGAMKDRLRGTVYEVVDGDSFKLLVEWQAPDNDHGYPTEVYIRLRRGDAPERGERYFRVAKRFLEDEILEERVEVTVFSYSEDHNRDIAEIHLLDERGRRRGAVRAWSQED